MDQENNNETPESPRPSACHDGDDNFADKAAAASEIAPADCKPKGTEKKRGRPRKLAEATAKPNVYEKPRTSGRSPDPVAVDPLFFAGLNGTLKLMVQQERQHRLSRLAIV